ncbi:transcription factor atoh8 isoform X2 [Sinocyclocheilus grahami]|uniref:transcription factor atoh8 isoform X2 n=1 Tax=Sinocyclocheilus grahami TaxID=75366 RepID=UPI0007AD2F59|nr:PREDICTED: protein atonal homolog 8-like isoform X2 [Sinocyclocheilus grahami]
MKNPHLDGHCKTLHSGDKRLKRKARQPLKRVSDDHLPYFNLYKNARLMAQTDGGPTETRGSGIFASGDESVLNTALDMRINTAIAGEAPDSKLRAVSEKSVSGRSAQTGTRGAQGFALERALPQAPGESAESPRRRAGEPPEIRAMQQTRRLLANARERTRVHTISAAFEALRKQVPCYSYGQKLSKLAILRIACNYILSLAQLADLDYSPDQSKLSFRECVEQCTRTLQAEGRSKKRKE